MFSYGQQQPQPPSQQQQQLPQQMLAGAIDPIPLPIQSPTSKEQVQRYFLRYQALKAQFGEPNSNDEFNELKRILTEFSARQAQMHRNRQMLQQQQQQGHSPQLHQQQQPPQLPQQPPQQQQQQQQQQQPPQQQQPRLQPQRNVQMQGVSPQMAPSPNAAVPQQTIGNGQQSRAPSMGGIPGTPQASSAFTQDQIAMLRSQLMVCKALYKKQPPPVQSLAHIFPNEYTQLQFQPASPAQQRSPSVPQIPGAPSAMAPSPQAATQQPPPPPPPQAQVQHFQNPQHSPSAVTTNRQSRTPSISSPVVIPQHQQQQHLAQAITQVATPPQVIPQAPEPKTNAEKLGLKAAVNPWSYIADEVPFENLIARQKQLFVPTIMPRSLDVVEMKENRERMINDAMAARIHELVKYETNDDSKELDDDTVDKLVELKSLRLVNYNKALKGDLASQIYYFNTVGIDETNRHQYTRMRRSQLQDALITENFDREQQRVRMQSVKKQRTLHLENLQKHCYSVLESNKARKARQLKLGKLMVQYHHTTEKEEQKRIERTAKQRLQALRANDEEAYIKLLDQTKDTRITHLLKQTNTFLSSLAEAVKTQQAESKGVRGAVDEAGDVAEFDDDEDNEKIDYYAVAHRIKEDVTKQPSILVGGTLKEYQIKGLQWMVSLYNNNLNGILADEMGLGKTIQTISLITYLIETKKHSGPYLVIVPLSTLTNWTLEFEKWAPSVKKIVYKGPPPVRKQQQAAIRSGDFQVLLTTYEYIIKDRPILSRIRWIHMIIDEGHRMKNAQSKLSYTLTTYYSSKYRLILTGTPLQNNLPELWALLNFALPKIFNSVKSFDEWFNTPFANTGAQDKMDLSEEETLLIIRRLHKVLRPFLLRRLKKDVEKDLPDKVEKVIKCKMSALQLKLYQQMLKYKMLFLGEGAQGASNQGVKGLNNQIMQLRKICNHPYVFEEVESLINPTKQNGDDLWRAAGKFELLDRILPKFKATGHRVLMFFQMTQIMDIMEDFLRCKGLQYLRLDGSTKADERSDLLKIFNAKDSPYFAFLLSTRAGGLGLNLQTADTVIIYDTDWNPHQDLQAQDRAHRIGQTKEVRILRLITESSVEENILERAHAKLEIDGKVIQAGKFDNKSTNEEQEAFLRSLLEAEDARRGQKEDDDEDLNDEELNDVLARTEEEREVFRQLDIERTANDPWKGRRLMLEEELPDVYHQESYDHYVEPESMDNYGRGTRERKIMHYDDGLTEEQWLEAVDDDNDTLEEAIARKRARQAKRKKNLGSESPIPIVPDSPPVTGSAKKKRGRKPKEQVEDIPAMPPRKKAKGRPPKLKETLTPEQRLDLTTKARAIFESVVSLQDEVRGRPRIELFLELPSKKLYPDYYVLIKDPIACDLIEKRINNNTYQSIKTFLDDFNLMFKNARIYNEEGSIVYEDANELERVMKDKCTELDVPLELPPPPPPPPAAPQPPQPQQVTLEQQPPQPQALLDGSLANALKPSIPNNDFSKSLENNSAATMLPTANGHTGNENGDLLNGSDTLGTFDADFNFDHGDGDGDDDFRPDDNDDDLLNDFS